MPDHDAAPDPMDKAYAQADAVLSDDSARAARRARVLAAVAREPATPPAGTSLPIRRPAWRRGGWLVAASVAGVSLYLTIQLYPSAPFRPHPAPTAPAVMPPPAAGAVAETRKPASPTVAVAQRSATRSSEDFPAAAPSPAPPPPALPPPTAETLPAAPSAPSQIVTTGQRRREAAPNSQAGPQETHGDRLPEAMVSARGDLEPTPNSDLVVPRASAPSAAPKSSAGSPSQVVRLHAAAAAGRTGELAALLAEGVPVDATDADGETALMKSIQADHPAAAALLRRRGANLDRKNQSGDSARDMASAMGDPELNQALGLDP